MDPIRQNLGTLQCVFVSSGKYYFLLSVYFMHLTFFITNSPWCIIRLFQTQKDLRNFTFSFYFRAMNTLTLTALVVVFVGKLMHTIKIECFLYLYQQQCVIYCNCILPILQNCRRRTRKTNAFQICYIALHDFMESIT